MPDDPATDPAAAANQPDPAGDAPHSEGSAADPREGDARPRRATPTPPRWLLPTLVTPIIVLVVMGYVADALTTSWSVEHPLALVALSARNRILVLTTNQLDAWSYYLVGAARLLISDPLFFLLGVFYGDRALQWVERKSPTFGEQIRLYESMFAKAAWPLVAIMPNNYVCLLAGVAGMPIAAFVALNVLGTFARLYLIRVAGDVFSSPIDKVLGFFADYRTPLLVLSVASVLAILAIDRFRGRSEIGTLLELEHDLSGEAETTAGDDRGRNAEGP